ncbi:MAG: amidohydrolase family protein [Rikenellaceae bacterium]
MKRKIAAHYLFISNRFEKNGIITLDENGVIEDIELGVENIDSRSNVEFYNGILIPGFVNCHSHLEYSYVKGMIPPGGGLGEFIRTIIEIKIKDEVSEETKIEAAKYWDAVMAQQGVIAVGDHNNNDYVYGVKQNSKIKYFNFIELYDMDGNTAEQTYEWGLGRVKESKSYGFVSSIGPHANYTMEQELINLTGGSKIGENGVKADGIVSVHFKESLDLGGEGEFDAIYEGLSADRDRILLVHSIYASRDDIKKMKSKLGDKITVVMCPVSNLYIENNMADLSMLQEEGINVALGTDSLSSNVSLSMVEEMKALQNKFSQLNLTEILKMATENGAITLGIDKSCGTLEVGKQPGVVLLSGVDFENMKLTDKADSKRLI